MNGARTEKHFFLDCIFEQGEKNDWLTKQLVELRKQVLHLNEVKDWSYEGRRNNMAPLSLWAGKPQVERMYNGLATAMTSFLAQMAVQRRVSIV